LKFLQNISLPLLMGEGEGGVDPKIIPLPFILSREGREYF
jgi:hypothetical protein